jgi:hypothetical protein
MRSYRICVLIQFLLFIPPIWAQQSTSLTLQPSSILQKALSTMAAATSITDVTLSGTGYRITGADNESESVTLKALLGGESIVKFAGASGNRVEVVSTDSNGQPVGTWAGPDGVTHPMSQHNLWTDSSWFFPVLTLGKVLASQNSVVVLAGQETKDGVSVTHLTASKQFPGLPTAVSLLLQHLSQMDLYLDSTTLLPAALDFNVHPDDDMLLDIPAEVRFSDYRSVNGVQVPFHIQKYLNNSLILDLQLQAVTLNSGLAATTFVIQ